MVTTATTNVTTQRRTRAITVITIISALIVLAFVISMNTGFISLSPMDVLKTLFGAGTAKQELILFEFRLPRIVLSILVGAGLAVSGCIFQGISRNALAEPGILGINSGAGLAVVIFICFYPTNTDVPVFLLPLLALLGAGLTAIIIYVLAFKKDQGLSPIRLLLTGIAMAAGISAAMIVLTLRLNPQNYQFVSVWLVGSIWGANWKFILALLPWLIILLPYIFSKARVLDVLHLGEEVATSLGTPVEKERVRLLAAAVALAGACVAVGGGIGFVGLIGPHLARRLIGPKHQFLLPASALAGALLMIVSDTVGRWLLQPSEIPTGIVVAVIGAPYFLYLLAKSKV